MRQLRLAAAGVIFGALLISGCSSPSQKPPPLTASSPIFDGLPKEVVAEVLASTRGQGLRDEGEYRDGMAQGAVRDFIMCREIYRVYRAWVSTGQPPKPMPPAVPSNPVEPSNQGMLKDYSEFVTAVESGDPSDLKMMITANGGCGSDVPLKPGDFSGPTLADAVKNL